MAVNVSGDGALDFVAGLDASSFLDTTQTMTKGIQDVYAKGGSAAQKFSKDLQDYAKGTGAGLDPTIVEKYADRVAAATVQLQTLLQKGAANLDPAVLKEFAASLAGPEEGFKALNQTIDFVKANIGSLKLSPEDTDTLLDSIQQLDDSFTHYTEKQKSAYAELRQMKNALLDLKPGSKAYEDLQLKAGKLSNELSEQNQAIKLLGSNTAGLQAAGSGLRGLIGGFEAVAGAIGLASGESEGLEKTVSTVISAMGVLNGVQEVAEVIDKRSALNQYLIATYRKLSAGAAVEQAAATTALSEAQIVETGVTEAATVATAELNAVFLANPAVAVLAGIAALAAGIYFLTQKSTEADEKATRLNKTLLDQYNLSKEIYELSKEVAEANIQTQEGNVEAAKAANLSQKEQLQRQIELDNLKNEQAQKDLQKAKDDLSGANNLTKSLLEGLNATRKAQGLNTIKFNLGFEDNSDPEVLIKKLDDLGKHLAAIKNSSRASTDKGKSEIEVLSSQIELLKPKVDALITANRSANEAATKVAVNGIEKTQQAYEEDVKNYVAAANAKTEALGLSSKQQLEIQLAAIRAQQTAALDSKINPNLTQGEQAQILADSLKKQADLIFAFNQKELADKGKLLTAEAGLYQQGSKERLDLELAALQVSHNAQIQQFIEINGQLVRYRKLSNDQLAAADDEYYAARKAKILEVLKDEGTSSLQAQISLDNARISGLTAGSAQDLQARKQLSQDQQALDTFNAQQTIQNQQLLQARLTEIMAKGIAERQKLDDEFFQHQLENNLKQIQTAADHAKVQNQITISDPAASANDRLNAQVSNLNIDASAIAKQISEVQSAINAALLKGNTDYSDLIEKRRKLNDELKKINGQIAAAPEKAKDEGLQDIAADLNQVASSFSKLSGQVRSSNASLGEILTTLSNVARNGALIAKIFKDGKDQFQNYSTAAEGAIQLIALVINAASQRAAAEKQYQLDLINFQEQYNHELNDSILLNTKLKENVFTQDFQGELKDSIKAITDATSQYNSAISKLYGNNALAKSGTKNVVSGSAVLSGVGSGAAIGAAVGTIVPVIGNVVGAAVGAVVGGIVGLFGGKKKADTYVSLLQEYPDLIKKGANGTAEINKELAKSLIASNQLDANTKSLVQDTLDWQEAIDKANTQLKDVISQLAGNLGNDLRDGLVQAFEDGTDAGKAFAASVSKTLQDVVSQLLFQQVFGKAFDQLQKNFADSFAAGGDQSFQDDLQNFFLQYQGLAKQFDDGLTAAQQEAKTAGLDIFQSTNNATSVTNSLAGQIKGITEDQANLLAGQFGGLRLTAIDQLKAAQQSNVYLSDIVFNTAMILQVKESLQRMELQGIKIRA